MTEYLTAAGSLVMAGPTGIMVSLGIETIAGMTLAAAYMYYNYISAAIMFLIAATAGARSESRMIILLSIIGGICFWFGWIHVTNQGAFLAFLIICGLLGVFSYMNDVNHEKYGIGGPGSKLLNIVFFIILFQVAVGMVNNFALFPAGNPQPTPDACQAGYQCDSYGNIQLSASVADVKSSGGLFESAVSLLNTLPQLAVGILQMFVTVCTSILLFSVVLNASIEPIVPGISTNVAYVAFLGLMQVGIWAIYLYTIFQWYFKPPVNEGSI